MSDTCTVPNTIALMSKALGFNCSKPDSRKAMSALPSGHRPLDARSLVEEENSSAPVTATPSMAESYWTSESVLDSVL